MPDDVIEVELKPALQNGHVLWQVVKCGVTVERTISGTMYREFCTLEPSQGTQVLIHIAPYNGTGPTPENSIGLDELESQLTQLAETLEHSIETTFINKENNKKEKWQ